MQEIAVRKQEPEPSNTIQGVRPPTTSTPQSPSAVTTSKVPVNFVRIVFNICIRCLEPWGVNVNIVETMNWKLDELEIRRIGITAIEISQEANEG